MSMRSTKYGILTRYCRSRLAARRQDDHMAHARVTGDARRAAKGNHHSTFRAGPEDRTADHGRRAGAGRAPDLLTSYNSTKT